MSAQALAVDPDGSAVSTFASDVGSDALIFVKSAGQLFSKKFISCVVTVYGLLPVTYEKAIGPTSASFNDGPALLGALPIFVSSVRTFVLFVPVASTYAVETDD